MLRGESVIRRRGAPRDTGPRVNRQIRAPKVRVVVDGGEMLGVMSSRDAQAEAEKRGLDLVEISPNVTPPVCKLMDYGKFKYEQKKKNQGQKKHTTNVIKELTLRPVTQKHDLDTKIKKALSFFEDGYRVKFVVRFRGRDMAHPEIGRKQIEKITEALQDVASIDAPAKMEGRQMTCLFAPSGKPGSKKPAKAADSKSSGAEKASSEKASGADKPKPKKKAAKKA